jgi:hypothetical protein
MKKFIRAVDLYKKPITLPIESESKYSDITGSAASFITYLIFTIHFYFEAYEVFARDRPHVLSNKNNINFSKSTLNISKETLIFFLNINEYTFERNDLLSYFEIFSDYQTFKGQDNGYIALTNCTDEDKAHLSRYIKIENISGINLCPKIEFNIPVDSFKTFEWNFGIRECTDEARGCKIDKDLYKRLREGGDGIYIHLYFVRFKENMLNPNYPFYIDHYTNYWHDVGTKLYLPLRGSEITTQSLFGNSKTESRLKLEEPFTDISFGSDLYSYRILFDSKDVTFHQRTYKTLVTAFSNVYSLFKLYSWVFSIILNNHYFYNISKIIINKNFDYESSINNSNECIKRKSSINCVDEIKSTQKEFLKLIKISQIS